MTRLEADITIDVDLRNPGQFLACCGVLEIAGRLWPESEGWFGDGAFHVATGAETSDAPLGTIVRRIVESEPIVEPAPDSKEFDPKIAPLVFTPVCLRLDWWLKPGGAAKPDLLKLWSAHLRPDMIIDDLHREFRRMAPHVDRTLLQLRSAMKKRFGFDPRSAWNALDVGFSPNQQSVPVRTAPVTEMLAAVGLQGFRPKRNERRLSYAAWRVPLPLVAARVAAAGTLGGRRFQFAVVDRGWFKGFTYAQETEEDGE